MIINNGNNFSVDGGIPRKNVRYTPRMMRCAVHFFGVYTPIHRELLQSFLYSFSDI